MSGIPVVYVRDEGAYRVALHFRVGCADETVLTSGITHAVEHLALYPLGQQPYGYNGVVGTIRTTFFAGGTNKEVSDYLGAVCRHLMALPVDRFQMEVGILRNEIERQGWSNQGYHYRLRYGLRGPGLSSPLNLGLLRLTTAEVQDWARAWFSAQNAALMVVGPRPLKVTLDLPHGESRRPRLPEELIHHPVWTTGAPGTVNLSIPFRRTFESTAALGALAKRLQGRLRYDLGLSYEIGSVYEPVSADTALAMIWATGLAKDIPRVRDELLSMLEEVGIEGPTRDELDEYRTFFDRVTEDPASAQADADRQIFDLLLGESPQTLASYRRELQEVTREGAAGALRAAARRAILTLPEDCTPAPEPWTEYPKFNYRKSPDLDVAVVSGSTFDHRLEPRLSFRRKYPQLIVGRKGVVFLEPNDHGYLYRYEDLAALVLETDGSASLVDERGPIYSVSSAQFRNGEIAVRELERAFPSDKIVRRAN